MCVESSRFSPQRPDLAFQTYASLSSHLVYDTERLFSIHGVPLGLSGLKQPDALNFTGHECLNIGCNEICGFSNPGSQNLRSPKNAWWVQKRRRVQLSPSNMSCKSHTNADLSMMTFSGVNISCLRQASHPGNVLFWYSLYIWQYCICVVVLVEPKASWEELQHSRQWGTPVPEEYWSVMPISAVNAFVSPELNWKKLCLVVSEASKHC